MVDSNFEKYYLESLLGTVRGIVKVHNNVLVDNDEPVVTSYSPYVADVFGFEFGDKSVVSKTNLNDEELRDAIKQQLWWSPFVNSDVVNVVVNEGVATLSGTVASELEARLAIKNAYEAGAIEVVNKLSVK